ncbi:hypothetical protein [Teredinibacter sp. KSP-S5-2]|uniref:hypothetical protein n=1 Tax=Teredinibacter sp. KSP-S5-2 TaxID=3034506 RepID=UPI0029342B78|nr:hypothetical protein [Teredinibacter sp. KSP-S5-2]WNO09963.1 hypothetical protein P5V12_02140 [Teredinibacter sp. KSP-S5-2]
MGLIDFFIALVLVLMSIFPVPYIFLKKGRNKLFFVAACIGVGNLTAMLIGGTVMPIFLLLIKVVPQLAEYGYVDNIMFLLRGVDVVSEYWLVVLFPVISLVSPILVYRRYSIFHAISA